MAIATRGSHVARAIEFFKRNDKYFGVGRTSPWDNETAPPAPLVNAYDVEELIGLRKVDATYMVMPAVEGTIEYRGSNWKIVPEKLEAVLAYPVVAGSYNLVLVDILGITIGSRLRVHNLYEGTVESIEGTSKTITLSNLSPSNIPSGSKIEGGALIEGARWVYMETYLRYEQFPLATYRQIGIYTYTEPINLPTMISSTYSTSTKDEFTKRGILEVLDNRKPTPRDSDQKEKISLIIEF